MTDKEIKELKEQQPPARTVLTADQIFQNDTLEVEWVAIPEWANGDENAGVYVRALTGVERDRYEQSCLKGKGKNRSFNLENARAKLVVMSTINGADPNRAQPVFTRAQIKKLGDVSVKPLQRIFEVAQQLSGLTDGDVDELVEDLV